MDSSPRLARLRSRTMRFLRRTVGSAACRGMGSLGGSPSFQALLERIHQADHVVRLFLVRGSLDRLAGGLALEQRLQRVFVLVPEFRGIEMRGLGIQDMAGELDNVFRDLRVLDVVEIVVFV